MRAGYKPGSYRDVGNVDFEIWWSDDETMVVLDITSRDGQHSLTFSALEAAALAKFLEENIEQ